MSIDEIQERKRQLQASIDEMITQFTADTGVFVSRLDIIRPRVFNARGEVIATDYVVTAEVSNSAEVESVMHEVKGLPFPHYDDGCDYCAMCPSAIASGHCARGEQMGYDRCGTDRIQGETTSLRRWRRERGDPTP